LGLPEDDPMRVRLLAADDGPAPLVETLTERHINELRSLASDTTQLGVLKLAEELAAAKRRSVLTGEPSRLMVSSQLHIERLCQAAEGRLVDVSEPGDVGGQAGSSAPQACVGAGRQSDGDVRTAGDPGAIVQQGADAAWSLELLRSEIEAAPADAIGPAGRAAVLARLSDALNGSPVDLLTAGGEAMVRGLPGVSDESVPAAVTTVTWIALAVLVLAGYRWLEILNGRTEAGPVTVRPPEKASDVDLQRLADLRRHIVRNIDEPGAVPGSDTVQPVTDVLEAAGDERGKLVAALLKLVTVIFPKTGYEVEAIFSTIDQAHAGHSIEVLRSSAASGNGSPASRPGERGAATMFSVTVMLKDARNGRSKRVIVASNASEATALRQAGYQAAAWVLSRSARVPSWGRWDESTSSALCRYTESLDSGSGGVRELEEAVRTAPTSGVLLALLAHRYDLEGERALALEHSLRAVALHPRYPVARYRAAISFSLLAADRAIAWDRSVDLFPYLRANLFAAGRVIGVRRWSPLSGELRPDEESWWRLRGDKAVRPLCRVGDDLLQSNRHALARHSVLHHAFRRSERRYWLALVFRTRSNVVDSGFGYHVLRAVNDSARLAVMARGASSATPSAGSWPSRAERRRIRRVALQHRRTTWQIDYNLACASAIEAMRAEANLEREALLARGAERAGALVQQRWPHMSPSDVRSLRASADKVAATATKIKRTTTPPKVLREGAMERLERLLLRPKVEQLTREWVIVDPDLEALRANDIMPRFERFLDRLASNEADAWRVRVKGYVEANRSAALFEEHAILGAESLVADEVDVVLEDLRRLGRVGRSLWDESSGASARELPVELRKELDNLLADELAAAVKVLAKMRMLKSGARSIADTLDDLMSARSGRMVLIVPWDAAFDDTGLPAGVSAVRLPETVPLPAGPGEDRPAAAWLVPADVPPLVRHVAEHVTFHYARAEIGVRFVVHERVGITARRDLAVVKVFGSGGRGRRRESGPVVLT
jgi:hypothetical protein